MNVRYAFITSAACSSGQNVGPVHGPHRMRAELERRNDAEVAAAATQCPEQIRILRGVRSDHDAVGEHDISGQQVVDRQAVLAREIADAAAERQAADAG